MAKEYLFRHGRQIAKAECNNFPRSDQSAILPQLYLNKFVEALDPVTKLPVKRENADEEQYQELCRGLQEEQEKRRVFEALNSIVLQKPEKPILVLCDFIWNKNTFQMLTTKFPWIKNKLDHFCDLYGTDHLLSYVVLRKCESPVVFEV